MYKQAFKAGYVDAKIDVDVETRVNETLAVGILDVVFFGGMYRNVTEIRIYVYL
jgi:hypothetical protein